MIQNNRLTRYGMHDASLYAGTYRLGEDNNSLVVIDEVERLDLVDKTFHTGFVLIVLCKSGHAEFTMNGRSHRMEKNSLLVSFGMSKVCDIVKSDDFKATALVESHEFMQETLMSMTHLWSYLLHIVNEPVLQLSEDELRRLELNYSLLTRYLANSYHYFRREAIIAVMQASYLDVCDALRHRVPTSNSVPTRSYTIFDQFIRLMAREYVLHRDVQWYAEQMSLTPKYLSEVVKEVSGRTAGQWITSFVVMELKSLLRDSDLSIKEIAVELNFSNQSFLGKYFKNSTGMSPLEYRNSL